MRKTKKKMKIKTDKQGEERRRKGRERKRRLSDVAGLVKGSNEA